MEQQPSGGAVLHLLTDLPAELDGVITPWWERHFAEMLTLDGILSARRAQRIGDGAIGRLLATYRLADADAADQPRPEHFALLPTPLEGRVTFNRRILRRADAPGATEPVGREVLQLLREPSDPASLPAAADRVRAWPGVLAASAWTTGEAVDFHRRTEVVQLGDSDLVLAELTSGGADLVERARRELSGWSASAYAQEFPASGVLLPQD
jgi:hypothetical protein